MLAQADGSESEIGAGICGHLDLVGLDTPALPGVANEALTLLCEFEARNRMAICNTGNNNRTHGHTQLQQQRIQRA